MFRPDLTGASPELSLQTAAYGTLSLLASETGQFLEERGIAREPILTTLAALSMAHGLATLLVGGPLALIAPGMDVDALAKDIPTLFVEALSALGG